MKKIFVGIDPGNTGGIAAVDEQGNYVYASKMPDWDEEKEMTSKYVAEMPSKGFVKMPSQNPLFSQGFVRTHAQHPVFSQGFVTTYGQHPICS